MERDRRERLSAIPLVALLLIAAGVAAALVAAIVTAPTMLADGWGSARTWAFAGSIVAPVWLGGGACRHVIGTMRRSDPSRVVSAPTKADQSKLIGTVLGVVLCVAVALMFAVLDAIGTITLIYSWGKEHVELLNARRRSAASRRRRR